MLLAKLLALAI